MKSIFFVLLISLLGGIPQFLWASIAFAPMTVTHRTVPLKKDRDHPRLKTYHFPIRVFAPIKIGKENIWTFFSLDLLLIGLIGLVFFSPEAGSQVVAITLASLMLLAVLIVLLHPIVWLIRWMRLLHWQIVWKTRYSACPGQKAR
jgi:hypothetical protein